MHTKRPKKSCFVAHYPDTEWTEMPCTKPPNIAFALAKGPRPLTVGGSNDFSAQAASGNISQAEGSFDLVSGVTTETMVPITAGAKETPNVFSLQLNTNSDLATSLCHGMSACVGWQQFVFSNGGCGDPQPACVYIVSWVYNYGGASAEHSCPSPQWTYAYGGCGIHSAMAAPLAPIPLSALSTVKLRGEVAGVDGPYEMAVLTVDNTLYSVPGDNNIPDLGMHWRVAEFNIFGNGDYSLAEFNSGSTFVVRTSVDSGTLDAPICDPNGTTGETNNLTLTSMVFDYPEKAPAAAKNIQIAHGPTPVSPVPMSAWPSLVFTESNVPFVIAAGCDAAVTLSGSGGVAVPKVSGLPAKYAYDALLALHLLPIEVTTPGCKDPDIVNTQSPPAGSHVPAGSTVTITFNQPKPGACQAD